MKELGDVPQGIELALWTNWLAIDIAADLSYNEEMNQVTDRKSLLLFLGVEVSADL